MDFKYRQAIIIRKDVKMGKGKAVAQGAHVAVLATLKAPKDWVDAWLEEGFSKVVLKVQSEEELLELKKKAEEKGLPVAEVRDFGLTQIEPNTLTAIAIGPAPKEKVDSIVAGLKLY